MQGNDELRKRLAGMIGQVSQLREAQAELAQMQTEGEAADGLVVATVGPTGALTDLRLDPRAMRLDSQTLAESILEAARQATAASAEKAEALLGGIDPDLGVGSLLTGGTAASTTTADPAAIFERFQKLIS